MNGTNRNERKTEIMADGTDKGGEAEARDTSLELLGIIAEMRNHATGKAEDAFYTPAKWKDLCDRLEERVKSGKRFLEVTQDAFNSVCDDRKRFANTILDVKREVVGLCNDYSGDFDRLDFPNHGYDSIKSRIRHALADIRDKAIGSEEYAMVLEDTKNREVPPLNPSGDLPHRIFHHVAKARFYWLNGLNPDRDKAEAMEQSVRLGMGELLAALGERDRGEGTLERGETKPRHGGFGK